MVTWPVPANYPCQESVLQVKRATKRMEPDTQNYLATQQLKKPSQPDTSLVKISDTENQAGLFGDE